MPAEAIGFLREDSTYGEKKALELLKQNLPKILLSMSSLPFTKHAIFATPILLC